MIDFSIQPLWQLQNLGIGNLAMIKGQRGMESLAIIDLFEAQDMVAEEVNRAHASLQSAAARVVQADRALRTGIITLNGTIEGLEQTSRFGDVLVPDQPAAGGGLRAPAPDAGLRRVLHDGGRLQPGPVRAVPRAGLPGAARWRTCGPPARPCRWTPPGRPTCHRWATARLRPLDERPAFGEDYPLPLIGLRDMLDGLGSLMRDGSRQAMGRWP